MKISRILQALATLVRIGCIGTGIIILISFGQPDNAMATGGCTAPDGICTTVTEL